MKRFVTRIYLLANLLCCSFLLQVDAMIPVKKTFDQLVQDLVKDVDKKNTADAIKGFLPMGKGISDISLAAAKKSTLLHIAAEKGLADLCKTIIQNKNVAIEAFAYANQTPLHKLVEALDKPVLPADQENDLLDTMMVFVEAKANFFCRACRR